MKGKDLQNQKTLRIWTSIVRRGSIFRTKKSKKSRFRVPLALGTPLVFYLGPLLAPWGSTGSLSEAPAGSRGPMTVSNDIALALDLGASSCSRGPLAFDMGPQLTQEATGSSEGA